MREREDRQRQTHRQIETDSLADRGGQRETETERGRDRQTDGRTDRDK